MPARSMIALAVKISSSLTSVTTPPVASMTARARA
jgi:hypothetical protein